MSEQDQQTTSREGYILRGDSFERVLQLSSEAIREYQDSLLDHLEVFGSIDDDSDEVNCHKLEQLIEYNARDFFRINHLKIGDTIVASGEGLVVIASESGDYSFQELSSEVTVRGVIHKPVIWETPSMDSLIGDESDDESQPFVMQISSAIELQDVLIEEIEDGEVPIVARLDEAHHVYLPFVYEGLAIAITEEGEDEA